VVARMSKQSEETRGREGLDFERIHQQRAEDKEMTAKEKPLKDCFKCCVCLDTPGFVPCWIPYTPGATDRSNFTQPLLCKRCTKAFETWRNRIVSIGNREAYLFDVIVWASKRAREVEHRRMSDNVKELEYKLAAKKKGRLWNMD